MVGKKAWSDGGKSKSDMAEETFQGHQFESTPDMELDTNGGTEKECINISPSIFPTEMDSPARCNSKSPKSCASIDDCGETDKEGVTMRVKSLGENSGL